MRWYIQSNYIHIIYRVFMLFTLLIVKQTSSFSLNLINILQTATFYPAIVFVTGFFLNFFIWGKNSSGAVPFSTMVSLLLLWFGISLPLVYLGYYFGYRKQAFQHPVRTNQIPRQVPDQLWYMNPMLWWVMWPQITCVSIYSQKCYLSNKCLSVYTVWLYLHD